MKRTEHTQHSKALSRDMNVIVYGDPKGYPVLVFPTQDAMAGQYEEFGMVDELSELIDAGKIQLYCVDTVDVESWSDAQGDKEARAQRQEDYYTYVVEEVVPFIQKTNKSKRLPLATGCSMGATHSAIVALRRPDLFQGCIALSGVYDAKDFFDGWMNETLYDNSPVHFMENLPEDHPYVELLSNRDIVFCVGQGAWEDEGIRTTALLKGYFDAKGINGWFDFWGFDVNHDWPWWKKQITYFMPIVLEDIEKKEAEAAASAKKPAARKAAPKAGAKDSAAKATSAPKATANKATTAAKGTAKAAAAKTSAAKATTAAKKTSAAAKSAASKTTAATKKAAPKASTAKAATTAAKKTTTRAAEKKAAPKASATKAEDKPAPAPKVTKIAPSKAVQEALGTKASK